MVICYHVFFIIIVMFKFAYCFFFVSDLHIVFPYDRDEGKVIAATIGV